MTQEEEVQKIKDIIKEKIDGIWVANHDGSGHRYLNTITGHNQRSVTTKIGAVISKPHLIKWAVKRGCEWLMQEDRAVRLLNEHWRDEMIQGAQLAHIDTRDDAGAVGTVSHHMAERYINDWMASGVKPESIVIYAPPVVDPRSIASARAIEAWFNKHPNIIPIANEIIVGNIKYSAGGLDFLFYEDGDLILLDFKTSNAVDQISYSMQVAAYKYFFEEMTGLKIKKSKILHLSKDYDKFEVWKVMNTPSAYRAFKMVCGLYDWIYLSKDKIIKDIKRIKI